MQLSPRRVLALRKEPVAMIAAARYHTAVYTKSGILYTWGANRGQLGYSSDVGTQTQPRIVSAVPAPVVQIAASDFATGCLLATGEVFVFFRHTYFKMVFSASHFPASMQVYRPPSEMARLQIKKISGGGADWIAVSTAGDVFHWTLDDAAVTPTQAARSAVKLWNVRSGFTAVADAAIHGGSVILCTQSGHVFVGQRPGDPTKGADLRTPVGVISRSRQWKFSKIPFLQRATQVTTNGAGAFGAIRCDAHLPPIPIPSASLGKDLISILPHWNRSLEESSSTQWSAAASDVLMSMHEDDDYSDIQADCEESIRLFRILDSWDDTWAQHRLGSDIHLRFGDIDIPVHSHVLNFRSPTLAQSLASGVTQQSSITVLNDAVIFKGSHPLSGLLLTQFLYSDRSPCIWDSRILRTICCLFPKTSMRVVRDELQRLAHLLQLPTLARACGAVERINIAPSLADDLTQFLRGSDLAPPPDVSLLLSDTSLGAHSAILRARSPFFDAFFGNSIWTASRRQVTASSPLSVNLQHISSTLMRPVLEFMYSDDENPILTVTRGMEYPLDLKINQLMNQLADCESADARIDYISALLAVANEMLIDKLKTICAEALRPLSALLHSPISYTDVSVTVNLRTLAAILQEAHIHESKELSKTCLVYAISNMETILEGGYVFDLEPFIIEHLQQFAQHQQSLKAPLTRRKHVNEDLSQEQRDYVSQLDLALPPKAVARRISLVESPKVCPRLHPASRSPSYHVSPIGPRLTSTNADVAPSGVPSPTLQVSNSGPAGDDAMFIMDDLDLGPTESVGTSKQLFRPKSASTQGLNESTSRTNPDLRQIMSDAESAKKSSLIPFPTETPAAAISSTASASLPWRRPGLSGSSQRAESFLSIQAQQGKSAPQASPSQVAQSPHPRLASAANPLPKPSSSQIRQDPASGTGAPVISPVRSTSGATAGSRRRRAQDSAWVSYQTASSVLASASPSSSTGLVDTSFSAIQNAQQEEGDALRQRSKKTIGEIQQEEVC